jgi:HAD superfamily phosphatase (TIGR01668 family)
MIYPDYYYESVFLIPYDTLWQQNIRGLIYDLDNTLVPYDKTHPPAKIVALVRRLERMGFRLSLVTNNTKGRLETFNKTLGLDGVSLAAKPLTRGIKSAMEKMGTTPERTAIIGDQLLSDIWGGKNAKITTILVKPLTERDFFHR